MKLLIASDLHGDVSAARALLRQLDAEGAEKLILLGDYLYHGPRNGLPGAYDPKGVAELLNACADRLFCVRGNCDSEVDQMMLSFPMMAEYALFHADGHGLFCTHGHRIGPSAPPPMGCGDVLLCGHTHLFAMEQIGDMVYLNPGSPSFPKGGNPPTYLLWDGGLVTLKTLSGEQLRQMQL